MKNLKDKHNVIGTPLWCLGMDYNEDSENWNVENTDLEDEGWDEDDDLNEVAEESDLNGLITIPVEDEVM